MSRRGKQTQLSPALESVVKRLDRRNGGAYASARVISAWGRIADGVISAHTTGAHLKDGVLTVYVDGNSYASHFAAMSEPLRTRLAEEVGEGLVTSIRFTVSRKVSVEHAIQRYEEETEEFYQPDSVESVPLTALELAQVEASVAEIPDEELRDAVLRATVKDLEWKKGLRAASGRQEPRGDV